MLLQENADSVLSAIPFHYFLWKIDPELGALGINHDKKIRQLRQERDEQFLEDGGVYVFKTKGFLKAKSRFFGKTSIYKLFK